LLDTKSYILAFN